MSFDLTARKRLQVKLLPPQPFLAVYACKGRVCGCIDIHNMPNTPGLSIPKRRKNQTHPIWDIPLEELKQVVEKSPTLSSVLRHYGFNAEGAHHSILKSRIVRDDIDITHIKLGRGHNRGRFYGGGHKALTRQQALDVVFIANSLKCRSVAKSYLKRYGLISYQCECGNTGAWRNKTLSLQLDHINGVTNDHRLENLRWICPNCHSQTSNYAGKALAKPDSKAALRRERVSRPGWRQELALKQRKYERPSREEMQRLVWDMPMIQIAKKLHIPHHHTIQRWCKSYDLDMPPLGYWKRRASGHSHIVALKELPVKPKKPPYMTQEQEDTAIKLYLEGYTVRAIASHLGLYKDSITLRLEKRGIPIRKGWKGTKRFAPWGSAS